MRAGGIFAMRLMFVCTGAALLVVLACRRLEAQQPTVMVVAGAAGEAEFAPDFDLQLKAWAKVSAQAGARYISIGENEGGGGGLISELPMADPVAGVVDPGPASARPATIRQPGDAPGGGPTDRDRLQQALAAEEKQGNAELWLVLVGHGTFDGREAKLNLRGPDVSAAELAEWLKPFQRPLAIVHTTSSSAPFMGKLAAPGRVIVSATRSGYEHNYARFGKYLAEALADPKSDLDKDGQISLLESFLSAAHRTAEFYKTEGRLATEHALIDDNGDGLGTPADFFRGVLATKRAKDGAALDGIRAHQMHLVRSGAEQQLAPELRARRDRLEVQLAEVRGRKAKLTEEKYLAELEKLLLEIATLYDGT